MKRVLITGGSSGIGEAIALHVAKESKDNQIYLTSRSEERLKKVKNKVEEIGATAYYQPGDVGSTEDANRIFKDALSKMGAIDVLVANAGIGRFKNLEDFTDDDFDLQFRTNVRGVFVYLRPALKHMKERRNGQIIVTSSNLGFNTSAKCGIYAATKHAVQAMVGSVRKEIGGTGVTAGTINPGSVDSPWFDGKDVDRSSMLDVNEVAEAAMLMMNQGERSNIDHILLTPSKR